MRARNVLDDKEQKRLETLCTNEKKYWDRYLLIAGIDEVGRGPLAGPCVAAAVIMPPKPLIEGVNDSKKLSEKKRQYLYELIMDTAISVGIGIVDNTVIDKINILNAAKKAFAAAYENLAVKPDFVLCDCIGGIDIDSPYQEFVGGDRLCYCVAAASIIAKVTRDRMMEKYDEIYPVYKFSSNKGYGTKEHIEIIISNGICEIHRLSFLKKII